jgi:hypothetical protein
MNAGTNFVGIVGMLLVLASFGCHESEAQTHSQTASWVEHRDPAGFAVQCPQGWDVETAKDGHVLIHSADKSTFAFAVPFKWNGGGTSTQGIGPLVKHYTALFPGADVTQTQQISAQPDEAIAKATYTANGKACQANLLCCIGDGYGMLFAIAAPQDAFAAKKPVLVKILTSFRSLDAAGGASAPQSAATDGPITYVAWSDPLENAFTTEIPKGWIVSGGVYHAAPIDVRSQVDVGTRDGLVHIQTGDANITTYSLPSALSRSMGTPEGTAYQANGCSFVLMHYTEGAEYSRNYVQEHLGKKVANLQITVTKDLPELAAQSNGQFGQSGVQGRVTIGQTDFTYTENGKAMQGRCFARTQLVGTSYNGTWYASPTVITAPVDRIDMATQVFVHMLTHTRWSQQWSQEVNRKAAEWSRIIMANFRMANAMRQRQYDKFVNDLHESNRVFHNTLMNEVDLHDSSGSTYHAGGGFSHYWQAGGTVVGTHTDTVPGINFTKLQQF